MSSLLGAEEMVRVEEGVTRPGRINASCSQIDLLRERPCGTRGKLFEQLAPPVPRPERHTYNYGHKRPPGRFRGGKR